jgi:hypothetical protein
MLGIAISARTVSWISENYGAPESDVENVPAQPSWADGLGRLFHRADYQPESPHRVRVLEHRRREVLHFVVTAHPTAAWTAQQIVEALATENRPVVRFTKTVVESSRAEIVLDAALEKDLLYLW